MPDNSAPNLGEVYEIRIQGQLHPHWADWFDGFAIMNLENGESALRGPVIDQSALHSVLGKIRDLNLKLISVNTVSASDEFKAG